MTNKQNSSDAQLPFLTRLVEVFLRGDVAILLILMSLVLGAAALLLTPREEEPQIVVPMADVFVSAPGLSAEEVERQVTSRLEKLLYQIDGVEYVYSMSKPGQCVVTVRFYVGEDREDSLVKIYNQVNSAIDQVPPSVESWVVKPLEVDDVPIVIASIYSRDPERYSDFELRRLAEEVQQELQAIPNTNRVQVLGGRPRRIQVYLDPQRLAAHGTSAAQVKDALQIGNVNSRNGRFEQQNQEFIVESGNFIGGISELEDIVVNVIDDRPVYLKSVATIIDGPAEAESYSWIGYGSAADESSHEAGLYPAVHLSIAKRKGTNAVWVADAVQDRLAELAPQLFPDGVAYAITRDYGETSADKVNELIEGLIVAVLTVVGLIGYIIGWRAALVIALAIPVCYSLTLFVNLLAGYTINRVTMFALILALGLLVDDPITDVENIARYFAMRVLPPRASVLVAVQEVRPALLLSTLAIIASFLPLAFITGMMGPYMAPMALNVPLTVTISTIVAFLITPWMAMVSLKQKESSQSESEEFNLSQQPMYRISKLMLRPILERKLYAWGVLAGIMLLLISAMILPLLRYVPVKMLPYDNKNEFQVIVDMPEGTPLEKTDAVSRRIGNYLSGLAEVKDYQIFCGLSSPMDFNGLVRHYFLRKGSHVADIRVNLVPKDNRVQLSHEILLRIREPLHKLGRSLGANIKLVEIPPGPPVLATVTAEVYGPPDRDYSELISVAKHVEERMSREPGLVDLDVSTEADQIRYSFITDKPKAALSGVSTKEITETLSVALQGEQATILHLPNEINPLVVELRLPRDRRSAIDDLEEIYVQGEQGQLVQLGSLGKFAQTIDDKTIYHKNLKRVVYVYAEVAGISPAEAVVDIQADLKESDELYVAETSPRPLSGRSWMSPGGAVSWAIPGGYSVNWSGEGEWDITLDVFRDLGLAFGAALFGIFVILMFQTGSRTLPILIMLAIPLTLIGIMPGFWLLNVIWNQPVGGHPNPVFFTATSMIGMIALAGIVVRNSVVLIDFIHMAHTEGHSLQESIIRSVAVRTRPILLTAGTTLLANWVITLEPVFSGLAWAIIFGILTSTFFTLIVIPTTYWLLYSQSEDSSQSGAEQNGLSHVNS